ncbi:MAG: ERAP1-like C-terminal domain-containing protein [Sinobacteraceae bacterium]|nr:ERAP1-like C-terminal domain-containing protein [Nevskiaceae bacterium]
MPLIRMERTSCEGGRQNTSLSQGRFALDDSGKSGATIWHVPVKLAIAGSSAASSAASRAVVSGTTSTAVALPQCGAVLVNAGQSGYFRTEHEARNFAALIAQLQRLSTEDQIGLLQNTAALAATGGQPMSDLFSLIADTPADADPLTWAAVSDRLFDLDTLYDGLPTQKQFRAFASKVLQPVLARLGWDARPGESENSKLLRGKALEFLGRIADPGVMAEARRRFAQLQRNPTSVTPEIRSATLTVVAQNADPGTWEALHKLAQKAPTALEQQDDYSYLGIAADPTLARRALQLALTDEAPVTIRSEIIRSVAGRHPDLAIEFTIAHWQAIEPHLEPDSRYDYLPALAADSFAPSTAEQLEQFSRKEVPPTAQGPTERAVAQVRFRAQLRSRLPAAING